VGISNPNPAFDLTGRGALVTGAGAPGGIGFAVAKMLAELGAKVFLTSASARCFDRAAELTELGFEAAASAGDLTDSSSAESVYGAAAEFLPAVDIVVNNAGMTSITRPMQPAETGTATEIDPTAFAITLERNLTSAFTLTRLALPSMRQRSWGRVVFVSSVTGPIMAMRGEVAYAAAKAGMVGLMRAIAVDEAPFGITSNAVAPGWIATESQTELEVSEGKLVPMGRSGSPSEVAAAIVAFCLPAAGYTTGQLIAVDGGNSSAEQRA
jgi:3-oxoacyl-[acyl-carrier protein] reductase